MGDAQAAKAAVSSWHSNVAASTPVKVKSAVVLVVVASGRPVIDVSGGVASSDQEKLAGLASVLPAASLARAWKVWEPSLRPV